MEERSLGVVVSYLVIISFIAGESWIAYWAAEKKKRKRAIDPLGAYQYRTGANKIMQFQFQEEAITMVEKVGSNPRKKTKIKKRRRSKKTAWFSAFNTR